MSFSGPFSVFLLKILILNVKHDVSDKEKHKFFHQKGRKKGIRGQDVCAADSKIESRSWKIKTFAPFMALSL